MTPDAADQSPPTEGPIRRALRNAAWLLGGKGVGGLFSLVYLALAARTLGVAGFGLFAMILAYGQALANVVGFQSWQTVIRYGARHRADARPDLFAQVLLFATLLDLGAAVAGGAIAVAGALTIGPAIGWSRETQVLAAWFGLSLIFAQRGAPTGVLRLFDRFDLAAYAELTLPTIRLVGTLVAWGLGGGLAGYLIAWALADLITTASMWWQAWRELARQDMARGARLRGLTTGNPGIWRFSITTNLTASIGLVWQQVPVLAVGWIAGPAGAGGYRMATQLGTALTKPVTSLARSIYPEFARMSVGGSARALVPVLRRTAWLSAALGLASVLLIAAAGRHILLFVGGPDYVFAYPVLVVLTLASALSLVGFGLEPALVAIGRPGIALVARGLATIVYIALLAAMLPWLGPIGAAWATLIATGLSTVLLVVAFWRAGRD
ncbi:lipopolysaccharide biosynthesis protein [Sphingomonas montana]|uniref:lipopolysaccharide biosynthesis protein n=1 Tax=Sphingomonas montana TaxID=1843236 RepID=UPI00096FD9CB|nr:lipopolysaccharide biosynthesis protein [Sphingomonas montana]